MLRGVSLGISMALVERFRGLCIVGLGVTRPYCPCVRTVWVWAAPAHEPLGVGTDVS